MMYTPGQVRSECLPSPVHLSGNGKRGGGGGEGVKGGGGPHAMAGTREYEQSDRNR